MNNLRKMHLWNEGYMAYQNDMYRCFRSDQQEERAIYQEGYEEARRTDPKLKERYYDLVL